MYDVCNLKKDGTIKDTLLKMSVEFRYPSDPSITLDDIDFYVEFFCSACRMVTIKKEDLTREEDFVDDVPVVNWYAFVDTSKTGPGRLKMRMHAEIPDASAPDQVRVEYKEIDTNVIIDL